MIRLDVANISRRASPRIIFSFGFAQIFSRSSSWQIIPVRARAMGDYAWVVVSWYTCDTVKDEMDHDNEVKTYNKEIHGAYYSVRKANRAAREAVRMADEGKRAMEVLDGEIDDEVDSDASESEEDDEEVIPEPFEYHENNAMKDTGEPDLHVEVIYLDVLDA